MKELMIKVSVKHKCLITEVRRLKHPHGFS